MKKFKLALLCGALLSAPLGLSLNCAHADQTPVGGADDSRMRYIAYDAGQVVHLSTTVGSTLVIGFSPLEAVTAVAETDSVHLAAIPKGNYLFFKPNAALPLQPIIVLTQRPDGSLRRYVFEFETVADPTTADGANGVFYSVQFTYPADIAAAASANWLQRRWVAKVAAAKAEAAAASALLVTENTNPSIGTRNYRYVAQGDTSLTPIGVFDNGYSTMFQFPGNERIPAIFVIDPDGKEATASYSVSGGNVEVGQTAREFRLRDGGTVLNVYNLGYSTVGQNPGTGTTSPNISRIVTGAPGSSVSDAP
jgi:type IV secretion system protein VirB9